MSRLVLVKDSVFKCYCYRHVDRYSVVIDIDFMLVDTMFESHLCGYLSTGNGFQCVMVITIDFMLVDTMFECHFYG